MDRRPPSTRVGRYAVYGTIASGGMASVHWGRLVGEAGFARVVAIKRLHPQYVSDPDFTAMLLDEARIVARIRHPNVVPTLDVAWSDGELLLVMEYVHGEALSKLLRSLRLRHEPVSPHIAVAIICSVLDGLGAAHDAKDEQGRPLSIVHRDVTPQNILVGADGVPRIVDFGVAHAAGRMHTTRDGVLKGKISYMSPEQVRAHAVDRRTDVYAAGVVLWEMLTGRRAFDADSDVAAIAKVLEETLPPPSAIMPGITTSLDAAVGRAVAQDRLDRYANAREMALALEKACPPASPRELSAWVTSIAVEALSERAEMLAAVEADDPDAIERARGAVASLTPPSFAGNPKPIVPLGSEDPTRNLGPEATPSGQVPEPSSHVTSLTAASVTHPPRGRRQLAVVSVLLAIAGVLALVVTFAVTRSSSNDTPPIASTSSPAKTAAPSATAPAITASVTASSAPSAAPPASAIASAAPTTIAAPHSSAAHGAGPAKHDCKDPFRLGPDGILYPRPECL